MPLGARYSEELGELPEPAPNALPVESVADAQSIDCGKSFLAPGRTHEQFDGSLVLILFCRPGAEERNSDSSRI